ncbi:MAG: XdhC family protein [Rhodospirillales bacterium]|nr:XdhC family protein [Rhodospirillales bacterium]
MPNEPRGGSNEISVIEQLLRWLDDGQEAALAIVTETWGSSPCPAGSLLAINEDRGFMGSVSGGCVEGAVVTEALALIKGKTFKRLEYGVTDEDAWQVGLACGGRIGVFVTWVSNDWRKTLAALMDAQQENRPTALVIDMSDASPTLKSKEEAPELFDTDKSRLVEGPADKMQFIGIFNPPLRLLIVGAVHIAQALATMAAATGFQVTVIDPRGAWATKDRFPTVTLDERWPREALQELKPDHRTAVVSLSHDPKLDDPALVEALKSDALYIGALGSRRTHAKRLERLVELGVDEEAFARIHGPIGLDIGAVTPAEIAVSILAEIVSRLRARNR